MNSQLACGKVVRVGSLPLENPMLRSHCTQVSCGFQRPIRQMCEPKTSRKVFRSKLGLPICASHSSKARQILPGRFASLSARGPVEVDQTGSTNVRLGSSLNKEQLGSKEETFVSSVGTPSAGPSSFKNWQAADKQLVIYCFISLMVPSFSVSFSLHSIVWWLISCSTYYFLARSAVLLHSYYYTCRKLYTVFSISISCTCRQQGLWLQFLLRLSRA